MKTAFLNFYKRKIIFFLYLLLIGLGFLLLVSYQKDSLHLILNKYNSPFFDIFFKYATYLGDGILFPIVIVGLLFFKRKYALPFIISGVITLFIAYALKNWIFIGYARPYEVFGDAIHIVKGVKMRHWHSFPSGHTTSAFALFMLAVFYIEKKSFQILLFILAVIAGLSRIYLSQHFLQDVVAGAILGTFISLLSYQLILGKMQRIE